MAIQPGMTAKESTQLAKLEIAHFGFCLESFSVKRRISVEQRNYIETQKIEARVSMRK